MTKLIEDEEIKKHQTYFRVRQKKSVFDLKVKMKPAKYSDKSASGYLL